MFYSELVKKLGIEETISSFYSVNFANTGLSIQGNVKIILFSATKIILKYGKQTLYIYGNNLKLNNLSKTEIGIKGTIICTSSVEVSIGQN